MNVRKWICRMLCLLIILSFPTTVNAEERLMFQDYTPGADTENEKLNAVVECTKSKKGMDISFDTMQIQENVYSTITAYRNDKRIVDAEGGIRMGIRNEEKREARMNFSAVREDGKVFQVKEGCYVVLRDAKTIYAPVENGCFTIPSGFSGMLEIPFETMTDEDTEETLGDKIMGYGFVCVSEGKSRYHLKFYDMYLLKSKETVNVGKTVEVQITGENSVRKPEVGVSETQYSAVGYNMLGQETKIKAEFYLKSKNAPGVSMTRGGWLRVYPEAEDEVVICAKEPRWGIETEQKIQLERSWTTAVLTENGHNAAIAKPEEISPVMNEDLWNTENQTLWIIRGLFAAGAAAFFIYYIWARKKNRRN